MKIAGPGKGAILTGLFAGLASSTALTLPVTMPLLVAATAGFVYVLAEPTFLSALTDRVS